MAGIVADNPKGQSTAEQTKSILSQIDSFLATARTNKTALLSANAWITDMANFAEMNAGLGRLGIARQYTGAGND
jgi:enamine deaminase RidA (YjgF/YER057c/UK114 family)